MKKILLAVSMFGAMPVVFGLPSIVMAQVTCTSDADCNDNNDCTDDTRSVALSRYLSKNSTTTLHLDLSVILSVIITEYLYNLTKPLIP